MEKVVCYAVPIFEEGYQGKLVNELLKRGFDNPSSASSDKNGEPICVLLWPSIKKFMVYRCFDAAVMYDVVTDAFTETKRISNRKALEMIKSL